MAVQMIMRWRGATTEQYDAVRELVSWEVAQPMGAIYHVASHDGDSLRITDVWDTAEHFDEFVTTRLMPGVQQVGIEGEPEVEIYPAHAVFAPGYTVDLAQSATSVKTS